MLDARTVYLINITCISGNKSGVDCILKIKPIQYYRYLFVAYCDSRS